MDKGTRLSHRKSTIRVPYDTKPPELDVISPNRSHEYPLLPSVLGICIGRIALIAIILYMRRVCNSPAPERWGVDVEVPNGCVLRMREGERERTAIAVCTGAVRVIVPPGLCKVHG
jgi:hypothetical protein